jgi:hypothetical protein
MIDLPELLVQLVLWTIVLIPGFALGALLFM